MENKIRSYVLALLTLLATSLFAADFETTKFGAKAGKDGINTAAGQAETYADFWKLVGSKETPPESSAALSAADMPSAVKAVELPFGKEPLRVDGDFSDWGGKIAWRDDFVSYDRRLASIGKSPAPNGASFEVRPLGGGGAAAREGSLPFRQTVEGHSVQRDESAARAVLWRSRVTDRDVEPLPLFHLYI